MKAGVLDSITSQTPSKILVVDNDVDNGLLLKDFLQMSGFDVDVYFSSEEGIREFSKRTVQCRDIRCSYGWYWRYRVIQDNLKH